MVIRNVVQWVPSSLSGSGVCLFYIQVYYIMLESILFATKKKDTLSQQMTKRVIKPKEYAPTGGSTGTYQADLIFFDELSRMNHGYRSILTAISANSRFVYAEPLKKRAMRLMQCHVLLKTLRNGKQSKFYGQIRGRNSHLKSSEM